MTKRILSMTLALCMLLSLLPAVGLNAAAYEVSKPTQYTEAVPQAENVLREEVSDSNSADTRGSHSDTDVAYPVEGGSIYFDKETGTITDCDVFVTSADIPATIDGFPVTSIGEFAFGMRDYLTGVTLPNSIISIGDYAFSYCTNLASVTLPNSVTIIGDNSFWHCTSLSNITIPDSVTSIGNSAFEWCFSLTDITIPNSVTSIGSSAFEDCSSLASVTISSRVTSIKSETFRNCTNLTNITIPDGVTIIGSFAFCLCTSLTIVCFLGDAPKIGQNALHEDWMTLYYINGKEGWTTPTWNGYQTATWDGVNIPPIASGVCGADGDNLIWRLGVDGTLTISGSGAMASYYDVAPWDNYRDEIVEVILPEGLTNIGAWAFNNCASLTSINIPSTVTSVEEGAFWYCTALETVEFPDGVTEIGTSAFLGCRALSNITLPADLTEIGDGAFCDCDSLVDIVISDRVARIGANAFYDCDGLENVTIGSGVTSIGSSAFTGCDLLSDVSFTGSVTEIGDGALSYCFSLTTLTLPDGLTEIPVGLCYECISLESVTIPDSVTVIGDRAFMDCAHLADLTLGSGVTTIGKGAFGYCSSLTDILIPAGVTYIGEMAFYSCKGLTSVRFLGDAPELGELVFRQYVWENNEYSNIRGLILFYINGKSGWTTPIWNGYPTLTWDGVNMPAPHEHNYTATEVVAPTCTEYGYTLYSCICGECYYDNYVDPTGHNFVNYVCTNCGEGETITYAVEGGNIYFDPIEGAIISADYSITSADIPAEICGYAVTSIENTAFKWCDNLTAVTIPDSVTMVGSYAFYGCSALESIALPDSVTVIGYSSFEGCSAMTDVTFGNQLNVISDSAFEDCFSLTNVIIPNSVTTIEWEAFFGCTALTSVIIGSGVTKIEAYAFESCNALESVYFLGDAPELGNCVFKYYSYDVGSYVNLDDVTLYFLADKEGWTTPEWNGYPTATWTHEHDYAAVVTEPTCTEKGYTTYTCFCGDTYVSDYVDALGHSFGKWTQTNAPTCTEKGAEKHTCSRCGKVETRDIAALGHDWVIDAAVAATCTESGKTEGKHCATCGKVETAQKTVEKLGHDFSDGKCTRCGADDPDYVAPTEPATKPTEPSVEPTEPPVEPTEPTEIPSANFKDVAANAWYKESVDYAVANGLMNGMGNNTFEPDTPTTRAMLVTVLWRYAGSPVDGTNTFKDVANGMWYTQAIAWAAKNGIVSGMGDNKFEPDGTLTREQLATILFRYAKLQELDTSARADFDKFEDGKKVQSWSKEAVQWAVAEGIIGGTSENGKLYLDPQGNATRAQVATILMRFIENVLKK